MDFSSINDLKKAGFKDFIKLSSDEKRNSAPPTQGIYIILYQKTPRFLTKGTGGVYKKKEPNVPIGQLKAKWVTETPVVAIAFSNNIRRRLDDFLRFGRGHNWGHHGERFVWQIENAENDLRICWKEMPDKDVAKYKKKLLKEFKEKYNSRLPFANIRL